MPTCTNHTLLRALLDVRGAAAASGRDAGDREHAERLIRMTHEIHPPLKWQDAPMRRATTAIRGTERASRRIRRRVTYRRSIAILIFGPLLLAMAAGQMADLDGFRRILEDYRSLEGAEGAAAVIIPAVEALVGATLLARNRLPRTAVRAAALGGLLVVAFWTALASQAFARGLVLDNCGCFGVYLGQSLRWWILLEDAEFLLLAALSARATGLGPSRRWRPAEAAP